MKCWCIPVLALAGALALPIAAQTGQVKQDEKPVETPKDAVLKLGSTVDEKVTLTDFDGKTLSFKELRGKVVIVHFWSDRCPAERHANPVFKKLEGWCAEKKDVVLVAVCSNQNELGPEPAKDADRSKHYTNFRDKIREVGFTHRVFADHGNKISSLFQAKTTPHCFVIDAKGVLRYAGALDDDPAEKKGDAAVVYVRDAAEALLAGKDVAVQETRPYG
jgi:cytochrome oxidase Cu insertion factor (SCO1/SenC/PrrC family)